MKTLYITNRKVARTCNIAGVDIPAGDTRPVELPDKESDWPNAVRVWAKKKLIDISAKAPPAPKKSEDETDSE